MKLATRNKKENLQIIRDLMREGLSTKN